MDLHDRRSRRTSQRVSLLPVFLIVLVDVFGMTLVIPLLAIYAETFHATPLQATMLVSVFAACQLVSGPIIGHMSDRVGRKPMLLISQIGTFIGFIVMARAQALWMLYVARVLDGSTAGNLSLAQAYISDHTEPSQRAKSFGLIGIAFGVGFFIGPSLTGYLSAKYGLTTPIYLAAVHVGDEHPVHRDAAQGRPPVAPRVRRSRGGAPLEDLHEVFRQARTARAAPAVSVLHHVVFAVHLRLRAVCRAPLHVPGPPVRPARDRLCVRLRRLSRHHPAGRPDRTGS